MRYRPTQPSQPSRGKGMQLGRKNIENDLLDTIKAEEGIPDQPLVSQMAQLSTSPAAPTPYTQQPASPKEGYAILCSF